MPRAFVLVPLVALVLLGAPAAAGATPPTRIVVLGDSYSAGNGAGDYYGPRDCFRSHGNWGERYRSWLAATGHPATVTVVACSGATTGAITNPVPRTGESCWTGPAAPDEYVDAGCRAWLRPQVDAVDAGTDLVLLTIGGNDAGFSEVVLRCFVPALRSASACRGQLDHARAVVADAGPDGMVARLVAVLAAIHARGPSARVVLLGYPYLVDSAVPYGLAGQPSLDVTPAVRDLTARGMAAGAEAVRRAGPFATFVPVADAFAGHEPEPRIRHDNPARWLTQVGDGGLAWKTWYHPNPLGQAAYRDRLVAALGPPAGNRAPILAAIASTAWGADAAPALYASAVDPDGDPLRYAYRVVGPAVDLASGWVAGAWRVPAHRLDPARTYVFSVTVQDPSGATALRAALLNPPAP